MRRTTLTRLVLAVLGTAVWLGTLFPVPLWAGPEVNLEDALREGQVEATITGKNVVFDEPMLRMALRNATADALTVVARPGLELSSEDPAYADLVLGKESRVSLQGKEERDVDLYAYSVDLTRSFPPPEARYSIRRMSEDQALLDVLERIRAGRAEDDLSAQLAVWMQAMAYSFTEVEDALGLSLNQYLTRTLELTGQPVAQVPSAPPTAVETATSEEPETSPTRGQGATSPQAGATAVPGWVWIVGVAAIVLLVVAATAIVYVRRRSRARPAPSEAPRASPGGRTSAGQRDRPSSNRREPEKKCIICGKPLSACTCPGASRPGRERRDTAPALGQALDTVVFEEGAMLIEASGARQGHQHVLPTSEDVLVSRSELPVCKIPLPGISAPHALIFLDESPCRIKDLNSSNGTSVDGCWLPTSPDMHPRDKEAVLNDRSSVTFGSASFTFEARPPLLRDEQGRAYPLPEGARAIVSRLDLPCIEIQDSAVSAPHALIRQEAAQYVIRDLNSANGTMLGTVAARGVHYHPIASATVLDNGQHLRLGGVTLRVEGIPQSSRMDETLDRIGPYRVVAAIGKGGMAKVFEGVAPDGDHVALKVPRDLFAYDERFRARFAREARSMLRLAHPNIIRILDVGEDRSPRNLVRDIGGLQYIVMDYIEGCNLARLLLSEQPLAEEIVVEVVYRVAKALQHAHDRGVVHRDVKPNNILVGNDGSILLTDFGIARARGEATITRQGEFPGAPAYISPEHISGKGVDERSDIYSLGVVIYQMITGRVPFDDESPLHTVLTKHRTEPPPPPEQFCPTCPRHLASVAIRCLAKSPADRYQSADEVAAALPPPQRSAVRDLRRLVARAPDCA